MKDKIEIGKLIQEARKKKGYTQTQLAEKLNVSNKAISHWETGRYYPDYEYFNDIAKVLDINLNEYLKKETPSSKKVIKILLNIVFVFITIVLTLYFINNYNKFAVYKIILDNENLTLNNSYITKTKNYLIINLGEIDNKQYLLEPSYKLTLYHNNDIVTIINNYSSLTYKITDKEIINDINNLSIKLEYKYFEQETESKTIKFKLKELDNNSHLSYKQKSIEKANESQINLLLNNNYYKINDEEYRKNEENSIYTYNLSTKTMIYKENKENLTIIAEYKEGIKEYIVVKKDKIIEEYNTNNTKNDNYLEEIVDKIYKEYIKLTIEKE